MKSFLLGCLLVLGTLTFMEPKAYAGFEGLNKGVSLKLFSRIDCQTGTTCSRSKDKFVISHTGISTPVAATATTITASQCGSTFYNTGAVVINLPEASAVLGCTLTFVTLNASNFDLNPDDADIIMNSTNVAGDSSRNATVGNSIVLKAVSASQWMVVSINGTWADNN